MDDEPGLACVACCGRACVGMCMYAWYVISVVYVRSAFCVVLWCVGCQGVYLNMRVCRYVRVCVCS